MELSMSNVFNVCKNNFTNQIILRKRLGLKTTYLNDNNFNNLNEISSFVEDLLLTSLGSNIAIKKQVLALFLFTSDVGKRNLALKILSLNFNNNNIFLLLIHALFFMDITGMEREGNFYDYIKNTIEIIFADKEINNITFNISDINSAQINHMNILLNDFSHFFNFFNN